LALEIFHDGIQAEVLDRDAEVIEPRRLVLEEREEVLSKTEEAVLLRFVDDGQAKVLLVEILERCTSVTRIAMWLRAVPLNVEPEAGAAYPAAAMAAKPWINCRRPSLPCS